MAPERRRTPYLNVGCTFSSRMPHVTTKSTWNSVFSSLTAFRVAVSPAQCITQKNTAGIETSGKAGRVRSSVGVDFPHVTCGTIETGKRSWGQPMPAVILQRRLAGAARITASGRESERQHLKLRANPSRPAGERSSQGEGHRYIPGTRFPCACAAGAMSGTTKRAVKPRTDRINMLRSFRTRHRALSAFRGQNRIVRKCGRLPVQSAPAIPGERARRDDCLARLENRAASSGSFRRAAAP